jgi:transposase-like protein
MARLACKRHRFPPAIIRHAAWLCFRFTLSFRDVEELLAQRGIGVSYETVRYWTIKLGPQIAAKLRRRREPPSARRHLDEMVSNIGGERVYLWRAVDDEGEVLDLVVPKRRDPSPIHTQMQSLTRCPWSQTLRAAH